jgi:serine/threonine-protein kinase HipA
MQSLSAMAHLDFNQAGLYSYEQALQIMKRLGLPRADLEQQVLRAFFNVVGRNQDDHVKNIAFLMDRKAEWRLSPAFDMTYSYHPNGRWTSLHQMSINGKRDDFTRSDLNALAALAGIKKNKANELLARVVDTFAGWQSVAKEVGIEEQRIQAIGKKLQLEI